MYAEASPIWESFCQFSRHLYQFLAVWHWQTAPTPTANYHLSISALLTLSTASVFVFEPQ